MISKSKEEDHHLVVDSTAETAEATPPPRVMLNFQKARRVPPWLASDRRLTSGDDGDFHRKVNNDLDIFVLFYHCYHFIIVKDLSKQD